MFSGKKPDISRNMFKTYKIPGMLLIAMRNVSENSYSVRLPKVNKEELRSKTIQMGHCTVVPNLYVPPSCVAE